MNTIRDKFDAYLSKLLESADAERNEGYRSHCCDCRVTGVIVDGLGMCSACGGHCKALSEEDIERMEAEELAAEKP